MLGDVDVLWVRYLETQLSQGGPQGVCIGSHPGHGSWGVDAKRVPGAALLHLRREGGWAQWWVSSFCSVPVPPSSQDESAFPKDP